MRLQTIQLKQVAMYGNIADKMKGLWIHGPHTWETSLFLWNWFACLGPTGREHKTSQNINWVEYSITSIRKKIRQNKMFLLPLHLNIVIVVIWAHELNIYR